MTLDLKKEVGENRVVLFTIPSEAFTKNTINISKQMDKNYNRMCYVSLNKIYNELLRSFEDNKIDVKKFYFIDAITKTVMPGATSKENWTFITSPSSLTELSITIGKKLEGGKYDSLIFDSLSTLLIYNEGIVVTGFIHDLIGKLRMAECRGIFTALEDDVKSPALKDLGMFVDKIIHLKE